MSNILPVIKKLEFGYTDYESINLVFDKVNELIDVVNKQSARINNSASSKCTSNVKYGDLI